MTQQLCMASLLLTVRKTVLAFIRYSKYQGYETISDKDGIIESLFHNIYHIQNQA